MPNLQEQHYLFAESLKHRQTPNYRVNVPLASHFFSVAFDTLITSAKLLADIVCGMSLEIFETVISSKRK